MKVLALPRLPLRLFSAAEKVQQLFAKAGVRIGGRRPWDIQVSNEKFFDRALAEGNLGLGESYVDGWWECERLDELFHRLLRAKIEEEILPWPFILDVVKSRVLNWQSRSRSSSNARRHYDIGEDVYAKMLDRRRVYSCGYWKGAANLDQAQVAKLELSCRKLDLKPGMRLLDIGCGWGSLAQYAAEKHRVEVVGITVSKNQFHYAKRHVAAKRVEIRLQDYRDLPPEKFDRIVSIGMFEHVGYKNYSRFMTVAADRLRDDGLFLLHTIGGNRSTTRIDPWVQRYVFPNAMLPSIAQIGAAAEGRFIMEDWHNFGPDYDRTLMAWWENFENGWSELSGRYSKRFHRMWKYYLLTCAAAFRARELQVWQILLSKGVAKAPARRIG
ncbi:MAG TPA: cyclopropane fatty acyl phospholipid synthase [bacterium]|nr:cyclopropane fatty acyl phospholipid synthase [bacterium]